MLPAPTDKSGTAATESCLKMDALGPIVINSVRSCQYIYDRMVHCLESLIGIN